MKGKTIDNKIMFYGSVTLILTLIALIVRTLCLFFFFDADIEYYNEGFLPSVLSGFSLISALFFVSAFFKVKKDTVCSEGRENNLFIKCSSGVAAVLFLYAIFKTAGKVMESSGTLVLVLGTVGTVFTVFYFLCNLLGEKKISKETQALFGFGIIVISVIVLFVSYFDVYELFNGPNKINLHMALITLMLFMINEIRAFAGEIDKGFYVFSLCAAIFFVGTSSIPMLIYYLLGSLETKYLPHNIALAGAFIYLVARLMSFVLSSRTEDGTESDL